MIEIRVGNDNVGWLFPNDVKEVILEKYLKACEVSEKKMPSWFKTMRSTKDINERKEIEKGLNESMDKQVELLNYWAELLCVYAEPIGKTPNLTPQLIKGASIEVDGKVVRFECGIDDLRGLWEIIDGSGNIFVEYQLRMIEERKKVKNIDSIEVLKFEYDGHIWGIDTPFMRNSKLVEYIEAKFWAEIFNDSTRGIFGAALGKLVAVLVRRWNTEGVGFLEEVVVDSFTEVNVAQKERYFKDLKMDTVMEVGFFLLRRVDFLRKGLPMPIESLRALRELVGLIH